jgi:hypothetical protein
MLASHPIRSVDPETKFFGTKVVRTDGDDDLDRATIHAWTPPHDAFQPQGRRTSCSGGTPTISVKSLIMCA